MQVWIAGMIWLHVHLVDYGRDNQAKLWKNLVLLNTCVAFEFERGSTTKNVTPITPFVICYHIQEEEHRKIFHKHGSFCSKSLNRNFLMPRDRRSHQQSWSSFMEPRRPRDGTSGHHHRGDTHRNSNLYCDTILKDSIHNTPQCGLKGFVATP